MEYYQKELDDIRTILQANPEGLTILEIAEKLKVNRNSVAKYMDVLRTNGSVEMKQIGPSKIFRLSQRLPLSALINEYQDSILSIDKELKVVRVNKNFNTLVPLKKVISMGNKLTEEPFRAFYSEIEAEIRKAMNGKEARKDIILRKGSKDLHLHVKVIPSIFEDGSPGATLLIRDTTEKTLTEKALKAEREQLLSIFDSFNQMVYVSDPVTYEILYVNDYLKRTLGKDPTGSQCYKEFQNKIFPCGFCNNETILKNKGESCQWEFHNPVLNKDLMITDKIIRWPDGRDVRLEIAVDITDIKEVERKLKESEKELKRSQEISGLGRWKLDLVTNKLTWSPGVYTLFGLDPENAEVTYDIFLRLIHPEDKDFVNKTYEASVKKKKPYDAVHRIIRPNGEILFVREMGETTYDEKTGEPLFSTGTIQDITKIRATEEELKNSQEAYKSIVENANEGMTISTPEGKYLFVNKKWTEMIGYPEKEILGKEGPDFLDKSHKEDVILNIRKGLKEGKNFSREFRFNKKDGSILWTFCNMSPMYNSEGKYLGNLSMHTDITKRKNAEEESKSMSKFPSENPNPVLRATNDGILIFANAASNPILNHYKIKVGDPIHEFARKIQLEALRTQKVQEIEIDIGNKIYAFSVVPVPGADYTNVYAFDITGFKNWDLKNPTMAKKPDNKVDKKVR